MKNILDVLKIKADKESENAKKIKADKESEQNPHGKVPCRGLKIQLTFQSAT